MSKPRCRVIPGNRTTQTIQQMLVFDTETHQDQLSPDTVGHRLNFGLCAYSRRLVDGGWSSPGWQRFTTPHEFWELVELACRDKTTLYLFCHNTGFDLPVLDTFRLLPEMGWTFTRLCIDAPPTIIHARKGTKRLVILDTLNWWRQPLSAMGKTLGLPKLDMPGEGGTLQEWDTYCKRDVEIPLYMVQKWADFLKDNDLGGFAPTLASQAHRTWRHRFMPTEVFVHQDARADAVARNCYHGGRVECYRIGKGTDRLHVLDVNSMYPHVMQKHLYPTELVYMSSIPTVHDLRRYLPDCLVCARVTVSVSEPALPVRASGKLIYPTGTFKADLSTPELLWVFAHGLVHQVHQLTCWRSADLFSDFVTYMYRQRLAAKDRGDEVGSHQFKILSNSLYGKFGQRGMVWEEVGECDPGIVRVWDEVDMDFGLVIHKRAVGGVEQEKIEEPESYLSMPAIAAHVTAYARMLLWNLQNIAGRANVYYCDTDSLVVNDIGRARLDHLVHPTRLGALKDEGTYDEWEIWGPKDYRLGDKQRIKGIPAQAKRVAPGRYVCDRWSGLAGLLRLGQADMPTTTRHTKVLARHYDKGTVLADGTVVPLVLSEETDGNEDKESF